MTVLESSQIEIRTGDGVTFCLPLAGPVSRFLALTIDWAAVTTTVMMLSLVLKYIPGLTEDVRGATLAIAWFVFSIGYPLATEWTWGGRTIGKRVLGLRVADATGLRLTFPQVLIRNLLRSADALPVFYLVGGIAMIAGRKMQRLGDLAAGTIVLRTREMPLPQLPRESTVRINSMKAYRTLAARLRQKTSPAAAQTALEALRRRDQLDSQSRLEVFREIAAGFRRMVEFPEDAVAHLTDEQYLWNVAEILFETGKWR